MADSSSSIPPFVALSAAQHSLFPNPQVFRKEPYGPSVDVYAWAWIAFQLFQESLLEQQLGITSEAQAKCYADRLSCQVRQVCRVCLRVDGNLTDSKPIQRGQCLRGRAGGGERGECGG